jgi:putative peptide zinc metalloprotease protein
MLAGTLRILALLLPIAAIVYQVVRIGRRSAKSVWRRTDERPVARGFAVTAAIAVLTLIALAWWPSGQYQPVAANERGALQDTTRMVRPKASVGGVRNQATPRTAYALVPRGGGPALLLSRTGDGTVQGIVTTGAETGVAFPFRLPDPPGAGDNQALAVNTGDGTVVYDVAVALVWVTDGDPALNRNEAYALASCTDCVTVAVAFQVVLIIGQSDAIAPLNAAVAGNSGCLRCTTTALAMQLVLTLQEIPSEDLQRQIESALGKVDDVINVDDPLGYLLSIQADVLGLLTDAGLVDNVASTGATATTVTPTSVTTVATTVAPTSSTTDAPTTTSTEPVQTTTTDAPATTSPVDAG